MSKLNSLQTSTVARCAQIAGAAFCAEGVVQLVHPQHTGSKVVGLAGHLNLGFFIIALLFAAPVFIALGRLTGRRRMQTVAQAVAMATGLLGLTCITSLVMGHDGAWFNVIAPLTNAVWLFGSAALSVGLVRGRQLPRYLGIGLPVAWLGIIPLATLGGGLVSGAYCLVVGTHLAQRYVTALVPASKLA